MEESPQGELSEIPEPEKRLLAGAEQRISRGMWVLGVMGLLLCWLWYDWRWGAGFAIGAVLSALNFQWMKRAVWSLSEVAIAPDDKKRAARAGGSVIRFVLRYALIGAAAYVIFKSSFVSLGAFFLGLFLFVGAILVEVAYEIYLGFRYP